MHTVYILTDSHWEAVKHIACYLHTKKYGITYTQEGKGIEGYAHNLAGYTDTDHAGDINDRKSTTSWIFIFNGSPISLVLKKQSLITHSSMEAKLVAGSIALAEGIWLIRLRKDFHHEFTLVLLFTNNQLFITFSKNEMNNNRMKHIDTHFHYTQDCYKYQLSN